jgi:tetratricopeptide (TPR) repeat protein
VNCAPTSRCAATKNDGDDPGALDWAIFTAEDQLRTQPPEVVGMNTMHNLRILLRRRDHGLDRRRADELAERMAGELTSLGNDELTAFLRSRQVAYADEAIGIYEHALDLLPPTSSLWAGALANIANGCRERYDLTRDDADIARAIELGERAVAMFEPGHPFRPGALSNVCLAYLARFIHDGEVPDVDAAIAWGQAAVDAAPQDDSDRAKFLSNLAQAHTLRLGWHKQDAELASLFLDTPNAIKAARADGRFKKARELEVGLGRWGPRPGRRHNLDRAVDLYTEAIAVARPDDRDRAAYLTNLASLLTAQAAWSAGEVSVAFAQTSINRQVDGLNVLDANDSRRAGIAYNLGHTLDDDALLAHAATLVTGPPHIRLRAA